PRKSYLGLIETRRPRKALRTPESLPFFNVSTSFRFARVIHRRPFVHRVFAAFLQWALECAFFSSPVSANTCSTVSIGFWSGPSVWVSGVRSQAGDTVLSGMGDTV